MKTKSVLMWSKLACLFVVLMPFAGASAALPAFPTSGSCAMIYTQPVPYGASLPTNAGYNILAVLTFTSATAGTIEFNGVRGTYATTGMTTSATASASPVAFTVASGTVPAGSKTITFSAGGATVVLNAVAVNNGSTILIQGGNEAGSGVCQF